MLRSSRPPLDVLYTLTAPRYEAAIAPILGPLATDLAAAARQDGALQPGRIALDLGTGSGLLARALAPDGLDVIGIDLVLSMLRLARSLRPPAWSGRLRFVQGDVETLDFVAPRSVDVALASFGLAECDPDRALRAVRRVLRPGGRLYLQEWGPLDGPADPRGVVDDALATFARPEADPPLAALRAWLARPRPWDARLQDTDDYAELLAEHGFEVHEASEARPATLHLRPGIPVFLEFALAWAPRHLELAALPPKERARCRAAMESRLAALVADDGSLRWQPLLFRASGTLTDL